MSAREMFEELSFYQTKNSSAYLIYEMYGKNQYTDEDIITRITFKKHEQLVKVKKIGKTTSYDFNSKEIKAIQKQIEELGWLDE
jgi:hypothetical protein